MSEKLNEIILKLDAVTGFVEDKDIADNLNGIINDFKEWKDKYCLEKTDDD